MEDDVQDIQSDSEHVIDLVEVEYKERQIQERLGHIVSEKSDLKLIIPEFSKLTKLVKNLTEKLNESICSD